MLPRLSITTLQNYVIGPILGQGTFSKVYQAEEIETKSTYAIKVIPETFARQAEAEISLISCLNHSAFPKFHEALSDNDNHYLVTEFINNGTLLQHLNHHQNFSEHDARIIFSQIFDGVSYLHNVLKIAHLDLKLENIMIDSTSHVRIIDFGLARPFSDLGSRMSRCGSLPYSSPEMLTGKQVNQSTDIWSLGVLLYVLVNGKLPFVAVEKALLTSKIMFDDVRFSENTSPEFRDLVKKMLERDPVKRITLAGIYCHPWMSQDGSTHSNSCNSFHLSTLKFLNRSVQPALKFESKTANKMRQLQQSSQVSSKNNLRSLIVGSSKSRGSHLQHVRA
jgi:5'-AMP-activated protein kinase catalytic alpha subunit